MIKNYIALSDAIVLLMKPLVEVVIHDLKSGKICYINGDLSKRKVGDQSLLATDEMKSDIGKTVYPQLNFDGRLVKSISVPLEGKWLLCINCDISLFSQMQHISQQFLEIQDSAPQSLFKNDWQQKINVTIHSYLREKFWNYETLTSAQKKEIVFYLFKLSAFAEKNAADYVAKTLHMGRATIFNYLKEWKKK